MPWPTSTLRSSELIEKSDGKVNIWCTPFHCYRALFGRMRTAGGAPCAGHLVMTGVLVSWESLTNSTTERDRKRKKNDPFVRLFVD